MRFYSDDYFLNESGKITDLGKYIKKFIEYISNKKKSKNKSKEETETEEEKYRKKVEKYKDEYNNLSDTEKNKLKSIYKEKEAELHKLIKAEEKRMLHDKEYIARIRKAIDKAFESGLLDSQFSDDKPFYKSNKLPSLVSENEGGYWIIIDESQDMCCACSFICDDIANYIESKTEYKNIGTGDGDEGCIYIDEFFDYFQFYMCYRDQIKDENN